MYGSDQRAGSDERRLHLRAYNRWAGLLGHGRCPPSADLAAAMLAEFAPFSVLLDYTGQDKPTVRMMGARLAEAPPGASLTPSARPAESLLRRVGELCGRVLAQRSPVSLEGALAAQDAAVVLYRGVLLPFASPAGDVDLIHAVVTWTQRPHHPGGAARAGTPPPRHDVLGGPAAPLREPLVVWADGPGAADDPAIQSPMTPARV